MFRACILISVFTFLHFFTYAGLVWMITRDEVHPFSVLEAIEDVTVASVSISMAFSTFWGCVTAVVCVVRFPLEPPAGVLW